MSMHPSLRYCAARQLSEADRRGSAGVRLGTEPQPVAEPRFVVLIVSLIVSLCG